MLSGGAWYNDTKTINDRVQFRDVKLSCETLAILICKWMLSPEIQKCIVLSIAVCNFYLTVVRISVLCCLYRRGHEDVTDGVLTLT